MNDSTLPQNSEPSQPSRLGSLVLFLSLLLAVALSCALLKTNPRGTPNIQSSPSLSVSTKPSQPLWIVKPIWFYPKNATLPSDWKDRLNRLMTDTQLFYAENLGGKTFPFEEPIAIEGTHDESWYYNTSECTSDTSEGGRAYDNAKCDIQSLRPDFKFLADYKVYAILLPQSSWSKDSTCVGDGGLTGGEAFCNWRSRDGFPWYEQGMNGGLVHELGHAFSYTTFIDHGNRPTDTCNGVPLDYLRYRGFSEAEISQIMAPAPAREDDNACHADQVMGLGNYTYPKTFFIPRHRAELLEHPIFTLTLPINTSQMKNK